MLLVVQGALEVAFGLALTGLAVFVGSGRTGLPLATVPAEAAAAAVFFGPALLLAGALKVAAGARNLRYRSRRLGILALASGALSMFTCWCAPSALALLIAGLFAYTRPAAARAFQMGEQGLSREWIEASLDRP